jgi:pimeloyl-[acyl-carrier protein] methyl ester esterase
VTLARESMPGALHVDAAGEGPALVMLHGWAMHSGLWGEGIARIASRHRVLAVDLPGHGLSPPLPRFTIDAAADAVASALASCSKPLTVLAWSLGALVAMRWAVSRPAELDRLVLVCATPRFVATDDWPHAMAAETLDRFGDELRVAWKLTIERFLTLQVLGSDHGRKALGALRKEVYARGVPSALALAEALDAMKSVDLRDAVASIPHPALVIAGTRDTLTPFDAGRWLAARLPHARFTLIDGAGHAPFLSHSDIFWGAVEGFLDGD